MKIQDYSWQWYDAERPPTFVEGITRSAFYMLCLVWCGLCWYGVFKLWQWVAGYWA